MTSVRTYWQFIFYFLILHLNMKLGLKFCLKSSWLSFLSSVILIDRYIDTFLSRHLSEHYSLYTQSMSPLWKRERERATGYLKTKCLSFGLSTKEWLSCWCKKYGRKGLLFPKASSTQPNHHFRAYNILLLKHLLT